jgi:hypothetical protein
LVSQSAGTSLSIFLCGSGVQDPLKDFPRPPRYPPSLRYHRPQ